MIKLFAKADYRATVRSSDRAPLPHFCRQAGEMRERGSTSGFSLYSLTE